MLEPSPLAASHRAGSQNCQTPGDWERAADAPSPSWNLSGSVPSVPQNGIWGAGWKWGGYTCLQPPSPMTGRRRSLKLQVELTSLRPPHPHQTRGGRHPWPSRSLLPARLCTARSEEPGLCPAARRPPPASPGGGGPWRARPLAATGARAAAAGADWLGRLGGAGGPGESLGEAEQTAPGAAGAQGPRERPPSPHDLGAGPEVRPRGGTRA